MSTKGVFVFFFKFVSLTFLSLLFWGNLQAGEKLVESAPDGLYYLEDTEDNSFLVYACSLTKSNVEVGSGKSILGNRCAVVAEIEKSHLEEFLDEIESRQDISNKSSIIQYSGFGIWLATTITGIVKFGKSTTLTPTLLIPFALLGVGGFGLFVYGDGIRKHEGRVRRYYLEFESQIHSGIIGKGDKIRIPFNDYDSNRGMIQDFTDFVNQYGVPFEADALESSPELN